MKRRAKISLRSHERKPLTIVADASIATVAVGDGRMIPLIIFDSTERPDLTELVRVHEYLTSGDVGVQWFQRKGHDGTIAMLLRFLRPTETSAILEFDVVRQGILVDFALKSKGLYLQPGKPGDRLGTTFDNARILIHLGDSEFWDDWNAMFHKDVARHFRNEGFPRSESKRLAAGSIKMLREMGEMRVPR